MTEIKYFIHPGYVRSKTDRQKHYISGDRLIDLYGVDPKKCLICTDENMLGRWINRTDNHVHLYPDADGRYLLTTRDENDD